MPHESAEQTVVTQNPIRDRRTAGLSSVQTPSARKNGSGSVTATSGSSYPEPESVTAAPGSSNVVLATTRLSAIVREPLPNKTVGGQVAPPITAFPHIKRAKDNPISYTRVSRFVHIEECRSYLSFVHSRRLSLARGLYYLMMMMTTTTMTSFPLVFPCQCALALALATILLLVVLTYDGPSKIHRREYHCHGNSEVLFGAYSKLL